MIRMEMLYFLLMTFLVTYDFRHEATKQACFFIPIFIQFNDVGLSNICHV
jgi:hypothetical protein